jgi:hypothetical protein
MATLHFFAEAQRKLQMVNAIYTLAELAAILRLLAFLANIFARYDP